MNDLNVDHIGRVSGSIKNTGYERNVNRALEFQNALNRVKSSNDLKVSGHAQERMKERNINLSKNDLDNLKSAADAVRQKGGKEAVILYHDVAYLTSIKNNTIITAIDKNSLKGNVFTNIDSTIIL